MCKSSNSDEIQRSTLILSYEQSYFIWKASFLSLFSAIYALHNGYYDLALVPGGIFLTSINYWRKPDYSWRRHLDMGYVKCALTYQMIRAYNAEYAKLYYATLFAGVCFYPLGIHFYRRKLFWHSTYAHSMIHVVANVSNVILYSGYIVPLL